jgi:trigger factor
VTETQTESAAEGQTEAPKEPLPLKITAEQRRPGSVLALTVELPNEAVVKRMDSVLEEFKKEANIPGFRRGRAPMDLVRRRLGKAARGEAVARVIPDAIEQIIAERKLTSLAEPRVENVKAEGEDPVTFDALLEVRPEITLPDLSDIKVTVESEPVTDKTVKEQLERIRNANAVLAPKEGKVAAGNAAIVDVDVTDHRGEEAKQLALRDALIRTGDDDQAVPQEVVKALRGHAAGDHFTVPVNRKIHTHDEQGQHREEDVVWTWRVTVKEVKTVTLPDLDDEFAKDVGDFASLDDLSAKIRADLEAQEEIRQRDAASGAAVSQILDRTTFDAPASLVAQAQVRSLMRDSEYLRAMGMTFEDLREERMGYWESTRADAEKRVRADLVLEAIAQQAQIEVREEDLEAEIARMAQEAGRKPLAIRAQLEAKKQIDPLREQIRRRKIAEHLLANVKVTRKRAAAKS